MERRASKKSVENEKATKGDWNGWGEYMQAKIQKLDNQFKEDIPRSLKDRGVPKIFEGVVIHINGYTVPPADELRRLIYQYGGRYQQYYSKRLVTHIIATNLPNSKIQELRDELVVHPSWIIDCVNGSILLPVDKYLLYNHRKATQKPLNFEAKSSSSCMIKKPSLGGVHTERSPPALTQDISEALSMNAASLSSTCMQPRGGEISTSDFLAITPSKVNDVDCREDSKMESDKVRRCPDLITEGDNSSEQNSVSTSECQDFGDNEEAIAFGAGINNISEDSFPVQTSVTTHDVFKKPGALSMPKANDANFVSEFYNNSRDRKSVV